MLPQILVACDSFKGSLSSLEVGKAVYKGIISANPKLRDCVSVLPLADGGEGTVDTIVSVRGGEYIYVQVLGPLGIPVTARYGIVGDTAVVEMAQASGIALLNPEQRNPGITTSYGTGELIRDALRRGCRKILIGLGGSATNDGGVGMLQALGYRFLDSVGREIGRGGLETGRIFSIDDSDIIPELADAKFEVACDVRNPLVGKDGASFVFGPQKGADIEMVKKLDSSLSNFSNVVREYIGEDFSEVPGTGVAGGLGFALVAFLKAKLVSGVGMVLDAVGFESKLEGTALVITGEGSLDVQTCMGKAPVGVLKIATRKGVPVIAIGGRVEREAVKSLMEVGFKAVFPIVNSPMPLAEAMNPQVASVNIENTVGQIMRLLPLTDQ